MACDKIKLCNQGDVCTLKEYKKYCIFLDIDGTLIGSNKEAFAENIDTIQRTRALGHKVFISTGRATSYLPEELNLSVNFDGAISGAGAVSKVGNKVLSENLMPYDIVRKYADFAIQHRISAMMEGRDKLYHFGFSEWVPSDDERWVKLDRDNIDNVLTAEVPIEKFTISGEIPKTLDELLGEDYVILRYSNYGEVIQKNRGKGKALLEMAEILGIPAENTVAIGDSVNDLDMIEAAGIGIAMGNACEELKTVADMITDDVDDAGVSKALKKIFNL